MKIIAKHYISVHGRMYAPGAELDMNEGEALDRLLKLGAVRRAYAAEVVEVETKTVETECVEAEVVEETTPQSPLATASRCGSVRVSSDSPQDCHSPLPRADAPLAQGSLLEDEGDEDVEDEEVVVPEIDVAEGISAAEKEPEKPKRMPRRRNAK